VGSAGHIVHSGASGPRNIDALSFILECDQYGFDKKCARARYSKLVFFTSGEIYESHSAFGAFGK
jgi:hypothetical protein